MSNVDNLFVSGFSDDDGSDVDSDRNPDDANARGVLLAAENGEFEKLKAFIEADQSLVNVTDKERYTPLHRACYGNHVKVVEYLLQNGADIAAKTEYLWEPLHSCCRWNSLDCATVLIAEGANVNAASEGGQTPLHIAASHGACYNMVQLLLMHPYIDTTLKNNSDETALHIAKRSSKYYNIFDMADPLLDYHNFESV